MKKLEQINLNQDKIIEQLNVKSNELTSILPEDYNSKKIHLIKETDWLYGALSSFGRFTTSNQYASAYTLVNQYLDFTLDPKFIPFINIELLTKSQEGIESVGLFQFNREIYEGDYIEIYGDTTNLIYKGTPSFVQGQLPQSWLDAGYFQESFTKKSYLTSIEYNDGGFDWLFQGSASGDIKNIELIYNRVAVGSHFNQDKFTSTRFFDGSYRISSDWGLGSPNIFIAADYAQHLRNHERILDINETSVHLIGTLEQERWTDTNAVDTVNPAGAGQDFISLGEIPESINSITVNGSPVTVTSISGSLVFFTPSAGSGDIIVCDYQWLKPEFTVISDQEITKNWADLYSFKIYETNTDLYKKIAGNWVLQSSGNKTFDSVLTPTITSMIFTFRGYWLYWDNSTRYIVGVRDVFPIVLEGTFHKLELYNFSTVVNIFEGEIVHGGSNVLEDYRIWNNINFKRFPSPHPQGITEFPVMDVGSTQSVLIQKSKSTDTVKDSYRVMVQGNLVFKELANNRSTVQFPRYNDIYTKSGSAEGDTYALTTESHTLVDRYYYEPGIPNVEYKIRVALINPYDFLKSNNYAK